MGVFLRKHLNRIFGIISLIFGVLGTALIWCDSQNTINAISTLLQEVTGTVGYWQDNPVDKTKLQLYKNVLHRASRLDLRGFIFLMLSFIFQGLSMFNYKRKNLDSE